MPDPIFGTRPPREDAPRLAKPWTIFRHPRRPTLFWQLFLPNAIFLAIAVGVLAFTPAAVNSGPLSLGQAIGLTAGLIVLVLINLLSIRRAVKPVEQLTRVMSEVDPPQPGERVAGVSGSAETAQLAFVFNAMMGRLETERRESGRRMLAAQEQERLRLARELHDEIGQSLAGLMLEIDHASGRAPAAVSRELHEVREATRSLSAQVREIVRGLRPEALDDLGLRSALMTLLKRFVDQSGIAVHRDIGTITAALSSDAELVVYRVGQECLTNIARHSRASEAWFELSTSGSSVVLRVADNGVGLDGRSSPSGNGIRGMYERALLVGGGLQISEAEEGGVAVRLQVPAGA